MEKYCHNCGTVAEPVSADLSVGGEAYRWVLFLVSCVGVYFLWSGYFLNLVVIRFVPQPLDLSLAGIDQTVDLMDRVTLIYRIVLGMVPLAIWFWAAYYSLRLFSPQIRCPSCGSENLIPVNSPLALKARFPPGRVSQVDVVSAGSPGDLPAAENVP